MRLNKYEIHIWFAHLNISLAQQKKAYTSLSQDERDRADRFHFTIHKKRFIASRSILRYLISAYLSIPANNIVFGYTEHEKPYLQFPEQALQFNLSHSGNVAIYAFSLNYDVGIDIEKIKNDYPVGIAERFFSQAENRYLIALNEAEKKQAFYQLWSRKEAIIKATGKGFSIPLSSFSVSPENKNEIIELNNQSWSLLSLDSLATYQAAVATNQPLHLIKLLYHHFSFDF